MTWISCKDYLPKTKNVVLVQTNNPKFNNGIPQLFDFGFYNKNINTWFIYNEELNTWVKDYKDVIYWMEIPKYG